MKTINGYARMIGHKVCVTWETGHFTFYSPDEFDQLPANVIAAINTKGEYDGELPRCLYEAAMLAELMPLLR